MALGIAVGDPAALDAALRPGGTPRPVWIRALSAAACIDDPAPADLVAALVLCAAGATAQLRFLPFAAIAPAERSEAIAAWRAGSQDEWTRLALGAAAQSARTLRRGVLDAVARATENPLRLKELGRAAINARRALDYLENEFARTIPEVVVELELSRPAAGDALERLVEIGLATEITGRARDRVFALTSAWQVANMA